MKKTPDKIKEIRKQLEECKNGWIRTQADFDNYRKRTEAQRAELIDFACLDIIEKILPILDNFDLAIKHLPKELEENDWVKGVLHIKKQLEETLISLGVSKIDETGKFDPNLHEALTHENSKLGPDEIIETVQTGYMLKDRLIRPSKVRVSKGK